MAFQAASKAGPLANDAAIPPPAAAQVERAIRLTYAQMMLNAVFGASTGGMFLIGFALALGADNFILALMAAIPQYFVIFQFLAAFLIERGFSRKRLTLIFSLAMPVCWFLIAAIPLFAPVLTRTGRFLVLIGVIALVTVAGQFASNARSSWIGELIPEKRRGRFFGTCALFAGIVGAVFAVIEGRFLDIIKSHGLFAFAGLFFFGAVFGLIAATLHAPQPDCPVPGLERSSFRRHLRETMANRPFVMLALVHGLIALAGIAGTFITAYLLRDVGVSFFGLGMLNATGTFAGLMSARLWGRLVDRFGCRPVLIIGLLLLAPCGATWLLVPPHAVHRAYLVLPINNLLGGIGGSAMGIAISSMLYKVSRPEGRSVQFAAYSVFLAVVGAPMPLVGAWLVRQAERIYPAADLRLTFYLWSVFMLLAAVAAKRLKEPDSVPVRILVFEYFPGWALRLLDNAVEWFPFPGWQGVAAALSLKRTPTEPRATDSARPADKNTRAEA